LGERLVRGGLGAETRVLEHHPVVGIPATGLAAVRQAWRASGRVGLQQPEAAPLAVAETLHTPAGAERHMAALLMSVDVARGVEGELQRDDTTIRVKQFEIASDGSGAGGYRHDQGKVRSLAVCHDFKLFASL